MIHNCAVYIYQVMCVFCVCLLLIPEGNDCCQGVSIGIAKERVTIHFIHCYITIKKNVETDRLRSDTSLDT